MWGTAAIGCPSAETRLRHCPRLDYLYKASFARWTTDGGCPPNKSRYTGVTVLRGGLKNGSVVTLTFVFRRIASIVISIWSDVPGFAYSVSTLASAINFFRI